MQQGGKNDFYSTSGQNECISRSMSVICLRLKRCTHPTQTRVLQNRWFFLFFLSKQITPLPTIYPTSFRLLPTRLIQDQDVTVREEKERKELPLSGMVFNHLQWVYDANS